MVSVLEYSITPVLVHFVQWDGSDTSAPTLRHLHRPHGPLICQPRCSTGEILRALFLAVNRVQYEKSRTRSHPIIQHAEIPLPLPIDKCFGTRPAGLQMDSLQENPTFSRSRLTSPWILIPGEYQNVVKSVVGVPLSRKCEHFE